MNYSIVNLTAEASTNSTIQFVGLVDSLYLFVYSFGFLFGFPTHSYVIWLIVTGAGNRVASEFFILNLSVAEAGCSINGFAYILSLWSSSVKDFKNFSAGVITTGRPLLQCLISVERYLAVVHPVTFLKSKPLRYRLICCALAWIITLASCLFNMFSMGPHRMLNIWFMSVQLVFFISIQLFCLVAVLRALKQSGPGDRRREEENNMKRRAFIVILITTVSIVITYVPYNTVGFASIIKGNSFGVDWLPCVICYMLCGFVHPVLYLHRTGKLSCPFLV